MNNEIWKILDKWQRKSDLNFCGTQKTLIKVASATLKLNDIAVTQGNENSKKLALQITADIMAMLGQANQDISLKRRSFVRSVLKPEYKSLCSSTKDITEYLFGENLSQDICNLVVTNKVSTRTSSSAYSNFYGNSSSDYKNSFLGRRRSSSHHQQRLFNSSRAPPNPHSKNQRQKKRH